MATRGFGPRPRRTIHVSSSILKMVTDDEIWIHQCDYAWAAVVHAHLAPFGYEMLAGSLARLL